MLSYLILSPAYYADDTLYTKLQYAYAMLESKNMKLDFIAFRYDNSDILSANEYHKLFETYRFCQTHNIALLLNLSIYKLETLILLWLHGFNLGIHFKESDISLLRENICKDLKQSHALIYSLQDNISLHEKVKILYSTLSHTSIAKSLKPLCDIESFSCFLTPFNHAVNTYENLSQENRLDKRFYPIFVSTHNLKDLSKVLSLGANYATISPIFYDKGNKALGLPYLQNLPLHVKERAFALGGINSDLRVHEIKSCGVAGFASISYFLR
ncbi:thiamine phosphate synthase [Helicobacter bilis]|uniref:thiamine phosphate synthase n=1 Tax=Helicobacter bilis TaxID=37372 RepID=UPI00248F0937|nr:thiamine phosphate synthase [Helicobacter bilis]